MTFNKKLIVAIIGFSNFVVLASIGGLYLQNNSQSYYFYSKAPDSTLENKIKRSCGEGIKDVNEGKRSQYICNVKLPKHQKGAAYHLSTKVTIKRVKQDSGTTDKSKIVISAQGKISNQTGHATEANFCEDCKEIVELQDSGSQDIFKEFVDVANLIQSAAENQVANAADAHKNKMQLRARSKQKEERCLGTWLEQDEEFEEFDFEQRLDCKISKVNRHKNLYTAEKYYDSEIKSDLWNVAMSDEDYLLPDYLNTLKKSMLMQSLSVKTSTSLMGNYINWKDDYEDLGPTKKIMSDLENMINTAKTLNINNVSNPDERFLNKAYREKISDVFPSTTPNSLRSNNPVSGLPNKQNLKELYE